MGGEFPLLLHPAAEARAAVHRRVLPATAGNPELHPQLVPHPGVDTAAGEEELESTEQGQSDRVCDTAKREDAAAAPASALAVDEADDTEPLQPRAAGDVQAFEQVQRHTPAALRARHARVVAFATWPAEPPAATTVRDGEFLPRRNPSLHRAEEQHSAEYHLEGARTAQSMSAYSK